MRYLIDDRIYRIWNNMRRRCENPKDGHYRYYGGRGIKICDEWRSDYHAFKEWAVQSGYADDLTIDRIDNDGNYEPSNCRWATQKEQRANQHKAYTFTEKKPREVRYNKPYELDGEVRSLSYWCDKYNVKIGTVWSRMQKGYSLKAALLRPRYMKLTVEEAEEIVKETKKEEIIIIDTEPTTNHVNEYLIDEDGNTLMVIE